MTKDETVARQCLSNVVFDSPFDRVKAVDQIEAALATALEEGRQEQKEADARLCQDKYYNTLGSELADLIREQK